MSAIRLQTGSTHFFIIVGIPAVCNNLLLLTGEGIITEPLKPHYVLKPDVTSYNVTH